MLENDANEEFEKFLQHIAVKRQLDYLPYTGDLGMLLSTSHFDPSYPLTWYLANRRS